MLLNHATVDSASLTDLVTNPFLAARRSSVAADTVLYSPHAEAKSIFFIHRGQVRTYRVNDADGGRLHDILGPDEWCGEAALARHANYGEQAVVVGESVISEISAERVLSLAQQQPKLAAELIRQLTTKLLAAREDAAGLVFEDCNRRLLKALLRFSRSAAASPHADGVVLHITHEQLAQAVGVARETVSLALTQLRQQNVLRTGRNQLMFNPERLRMLERAGEATCPS